jgi:hypothetical protein
MKGSKIPKVNRANIKNKVHALFIAHHNRMVLYKYWYKSLNRVKGKV